MTGAQRRMLGLNGNGRRQKRAAMRSLARRWIDSNGQAVVPYRIEGSVGKHIAFKGANDFTGVLLFLRLQNVFFFRSFYCRSVLEISMREAENV